MMRCCRLGAIRRLIRSLRRECVPSPGWVKRYCGINVIDVGRRPWNFTAPLSTMANLQEEMTNVLLPQLENITLGSGCYLNEVFHFKNHSGFKRLLMRL